MPSLLRHENYPPQILFHSLQADHQLGCGNPNDCLLFNYLETLLPAKHRATRDRLEVYIPKGWRGALRDCNAKENLTTSDWIRLVIAERIGEEV